MPGCDDIVVAGAVTGLGSRVTGGVDWQADKMSSRPLMRMSRINVFEQFNGSCYPKNVY